jgi:flagellar biosynthetic protein FliR
MSLEFKMGWVVALLLCSMRLSALLLSAPFLQVLGLPMRVRAFLVLALSACLVSTVGPTPAGLALDFSPLLAAAASELAIGALMAFALFAAFAAFSFAGNVLDLQIGFNIANLFDPITRRYSPLIASILGMVAVALFFSMGVHHAMLRGFAYSLEQLPLGSLISAPDPVLLARQFGTIFTLGILLAAPTVFCLFLVEIAIAVVSRNLQQMNVLLLATPIKIVVGMWVLAYSAGRMGPVAEKIFNSVFVFWEEAL